MVFFCYSYCIKFLTNISSFHKYKPVKHQFVCTMPFLEDNLKNDHFLYLQCYWISYIVNSRVRIE